MGAAASVSPHPEGVAGSVTCVLRGLPEALQHAIYVEERWPVVLDVSGQAARFLRYQRGAFLSGDNPLDVTRENLRARLVGCLNHGGTLAVSFVHGLKGVDLERHFDKDWFPRAVLDRQQLFKEETWAPLLRPEEGDPAADSFFPRDDFSFVLITGGDEDEAALPEEIRLRMVPIRVVESTTEASADNTDPDKKEEGVAEEIAGLFGAKEVKINSLQMVEAAFDGEIEDVRLWLEKGYYVDSVDGRKHTALSEAAAQGHADLVSLLLKEGADPNLCNDTGRSALWRAAYNGHAPTLSLLLESGADKECRDKTSHENAFDVAKDDVIREALNNWDVAKTEKLKEQRREAMRKRLEERLTTAAERDAHARTLIRDELIAHAVEGRQEELKGQLLDLADEADATGQRPRGIADVRDEKGQTLLSLACQHGRVEVVKFLLTHWRKAAGLEEGQAVDNQMSSSMSWEARVTRPNIHSRDLKGWNLPAICVFHNSKQCLELVLRAGADPYVKSSYNKSAWDLAQDELDAGLKVVKSKAEIRSVIERWEQERGGSGAPLATRGCAIGVDGVPLGQPPEGSPAMLAAEVAREGVSAPARGPKGGKGKAGGAGGAKGGKGKSKAVTGAGAGAKKTPAKKK